MAVLRHLTLALASYTLASAASPRGELQIIKNNNVICSRPTQAGDNIAVDYRGRLQENNVEFDSSYPRGQPFTFGLGRGAVIKGWDQGLLEMCPGEKRTLIIPAELAYGDRGIGPIPPGATLIFETELVEIKGIKQEMLSTVLATATTSASQTVETGAAAATTTKEQVFGIATAPATPDHFKETGDQSDADATGHDVSSTAAHDEATTSKDDKNKGGNSDDEKQAECHLLGPFALIVQAALGAVALLSLVWKRYRETPKRPWKIFTFDVSKQVLGSMLTHALNLAMSMIGAGADELSIVNAAKAVATTASSTADGRTPNPCSFYLLNLAIDTTIGIPVLYLLLKLLTAAALRTPLARPPQSIKSGNYDRPPRTTWWLKQLVIYFLGLVGMKLFVLFLFKAMPWLPWVGDWALRWTGGNEALEVTFVIFIFPLIMNGIQYWIIDSLIKEKHTDGKGYEQVHGETDEDDEHTHLHADDDGDTAESSGSSTIVIDTRPIKSANPTPIPVYEDDESSKSK